MTRTTLPRVHETCVAHPSDLHAHEWTLILEGIKRWCPCRREEIQLLSGEWREAKSSITWDAHHLMELARNAETTPFGGRE